MTMRGRVTGFFKFIYALHTSKKCGTSFAKVKEGQKVE